jgi:hypothetical protein
MQATISLGAAPVEICAGSIPAASTSDRSPLRLAPQHETDAVGRSKLVTLARVLKTWVLQGIIR